MLENIIVTDYTYFISFILSVSVISGLILFTNKFKVGIDCKDKNKPQKMHCGDIPRIGGLGIFIGSLPLAVTSLGLLFLIASIPAFVAGFAEDLLDRLDAKKRLIIMIFSAILAILLLNALVFDIGIVKLPYVIAFVFTIVAIIGVINSINIIDGLNGLASGFSMIALLSFSVVLYQYQDYELLTITLTLLFATAGFFVFNFPYGKIFLGDGGSYFLGFSLALISILIVARHPEISPWYPFLIMIYPIWEVIYSIYRRKYLRDVDPMSPDKLHLHSLLYKRVFKKNYLGSAFILIGISFFSIIGTLYKENTLYLMMFALLFVLSYLFIYSYIVKFKFKRFVHLRLRILENSIFVAILLLNKVLK